MPTNIIHAIQSRTRDKQSAQAVLDAAQKTMTACKKALMQDWLEVRKALNAVLPNDYHMKLGLTQDNPYIEEFVSSTDDVVAYVHMNRYTFLWNRQVIPHAPVNLTDDEWTVVKAVEDKILELGFSLEYCMITNGNTSVWRLTLPAVDISC